MRGLYRVARNVLARTLSEASEGRLHVPVPSKGLHLVARFGPAVDAAVSARAGVDGWLLADTCFRIRPMAGYVLGFAGHPLDQLVDAADKLARASLVALRKR